MLLLKFDSKTLILLFQFLFTNVLIEGASLGNETSELVPQFSACHLCLLLCNDFPTNEQIRKSKRSSGDETDELQLKEFGSITDKINMFPNNDRILRNGRNYMTVIVPKQELMDESCPYTKSDAKLLTTSINNVLRFYETNYQKLDQRTDGGVGLSVLKSQVRHILRNVNESLISSSTLKMFTNIQEKSAAYSKLVFSMGLKHEKHSPYKNGAKLFSSATQNLKPLNTGKNWKPLEAITKHEGEFEGNIANEPEVIYPILDFQCLTSVIDDCKLPHICEKMYLGKETYSQYMLTHQILLLLLAKQKSCETENPKVFKGKEVFLDKLCTKAYVEAKFLAANDFPKRFRDLFAEEIAFCGLAGYRNFLRPDWLHEILSWQTKGDEGCFPNIYGTSWTTDAIVETNKPGQEEQCLVHLTSVSLAAYSVQLSYMFDSCGVEIFQ